MLPSRLRATLVLACAAAACRPATAPRTTPQPATPPAPSGPRQIVTPAPLARLELHSVIPAPSSVTPAAGAPFVLDSTSAVVTAGGADAARLGEMLAAMLRTPTGYRLPVSDAAAGVPRGAIVLRLGGSAAMGEEGYELAVSADSVALVAARPAGLFRGMQTLRQLLPAGIEAEQSSMRMASAWSVPAGRITDRPRFAWRGAMLDVARHFFTVDEVKQFIDALALYKMNTLHLHLSDDQGWRIQIDSRPRLTEVGGSSEVGGGPGGFFTKQDYAEIVRYAAERYITIVPEIDMPAHTNAAIASYPEIGCSRPVPAVSPNSPGPSIYTGINVGWSALCHDKEVTYQFVDDVIRELAAMTPGPYIHIGGDEVEVLTHEQYVQFIERVQDIVTKYGKSMVGWEEVAKARLRPTSVAQLWKSDSAIIAARQGAKALFSPAPKTYIDMKYTPETELGLRWAGFVELQTAYDWDPAAYAPGVGESSILGVEAPLWSETIQNIGAAMYLTLPRLPAIAEVGWTAQGRRQWEDFRTRIAAHAPRWRLLGMNYYPTPQVNWSGPPVP
ncbi:MAG: beta-N-acetylhexosaminidase [Gemmatimonadaceae bacterium]